MKKKFFVIVLLVFSLTGAFEALELGNDGAGFKVVKAEAARKKKKTTGTTKKSNQAKMKLTQKDYNEFVRICKSGNLQQFRSKLEGENISPNAMYYGSEGENETLLTIAIAPEYTRIAPEYTSGANNVEIIRFLLSKGADVNKKVAFYEEYGLEPENATTPLMIAACLASPSVVKTLLDAGAALEAKNESGRTAIDFALGRFSNAATEGVYAKVVKMLVDAGAKVKGQGYIVSAAKSLTGSLFAELPEVFDILIKAGADINERDSSGATALIGYISIFHITDRDADFIKFLLDAGVNARLRDKQGKRAIDYVAQQKPNIKGTRVYKMLEAASK